MHVSSRARRYARALAGAAADASAEVRVRAELEGLRAFFESKPVARLVLESPVSASARKNDLLAAIRAAADFSHLTLNLLRLLVENRRFTLFPGIVEGFREELRRRAGIVQATVRTAQPLEEAQRLALREALRVVAGTKDVELIEERSPELVAGVVTKIGSVVYDGSLASQLGRLRRHLISE